MRRALPFLLVFATGCGAVAESPRPASLRERPSGTIVSVDGSNRLTSIDVATGRRTVRRVTAVASCGPQMYVTGGRVIFAGFRRGRTIVFSAPLSLDRRPTRLGIAHNFVPSATEGRVWLAGTTCTRARMVGAREVTVDGEVTAETRRRVPGEWVAGAVADGLVLGRDRNHAIWDPATGRVVRRFDLGAAGESRGDLIVSCASGTNCRELAIVDTATGQTVRPQAAGYRIFPGGRFSPDGKLLATAVLNEDKRWRTALVDTSDGSSTLIPGRWTEGYPELGWTASGWLVSRISGSGRLKAYRPGAQRAVDLPARIKRHAAFVVG
jgi:hypothetical protein